jgi:hypothetical protein
MHVWHDYRGVNLSVIKWARHSVHINGRATVKREYLIDSWLDTSNLEKLLKVFNSEIADTDAPETIA